MAFWQLPNRPTQAVALMRTTASSTIPHVTVTAHATIHTKGSWVEVHAATAGDAQMMVLVCHGTAVTNTNTTCLMDVGIGAAGSEVVILSNLQVGYIVNNSRQALIWEIPIYIPSGSRIAVRCQSVISSQNTLRVAMDLYGGERFAGLTTNARAETYGADTANSRGKTLTTGAANTKGSYAEMTASTGIPIRHFAYFVGGNSLTNLSGTGFIDIAIGASSSEVVIIPNIPYGFSTSEQSEYPFPHVHNVGFTIPAGTRIAARAQQSNASTTIDLILVGLS